MPTSSAISQDSFNALYPFFTFDVTLLLAPSDAKIKLSTTVNYEELVNKWKNAKCYH